MRSVPLALVLILSSLCTAPAIAAPPASALARALPAIRSFDNQRLIDINDIGMVVTNFGSWGNDLANGGAGLHFPRGSGHTALFGAGLWLGANPRVAVSEYSSEYAPGRLFAPGSADDPDHADLLVYKVNRYRTETDTAHVDDPGAPFGSDVLVHHSWSEYMAGAVPYGAPWKLHRLPDTSTPDPSDSLDVPGPDVLGDQMLWSVYNDGDPTHHNNIGGSTAPLDIEVRQSTFAFETPGPLGRTVFLKFEIVNKGLATQTPLYASLWSDPDLGGFTDDLVGVDLSRAMGFAYNATNDDLQYGVSPPAIGVDLLRGPTGEPDTVGMGAFIKYINGTDPSSSAATLNYMRGLNPDGSPIVNPVTSQPTPFMVDGDPVGITGWLDTFAADRRMMSTTEPFTLAPGDTEVIWAAIVIGQGGSRLASIAALRHHDDVVQQFFDDGFPLPPPNPPLDACLEPGYDCPRAVEFWQEECEPGDLSLTQAQLDAVAVAVNGAISSFGWAPGSESAGFCALMQNASPVGRTAALQQVAAMAASRAAADMLLKENDGDCIVLDLSPVVSCPDSMYPSVGAFLAPLDSTRIATAEFFDEAPGVGSALEGANGTPRYGIHYSGELFGSTLDPFFQPDSFMTVELRFDGTQKAYRYLRKETDNGGIPLTGRGYDYGGFTDIGVTAWDVNTGTQLEVGFMERALALNSGSYSPDTLTIPTFDQNWSPDTSLTGSREYLFIFRRAYSGFANPELQEDGAIGFGGLPAMYTLWSRRVDPVGLFDPLDSFTFGLGFGYLGGVDRELFELSLLPQNDPGVVQRYQEIADCVRGITLGSGSPSCPVSTPVTASLLDAEAAPGLVRVRWFAAGGASGNVERSSGSGWTIVSPARPDASGIIMFEDRAVEPGGRYGYRLRLAGDAGIETRGEVWVEVPLAHRLSLAGFRPNPAGETPFVAFTLPTRGTARIEVLDVTGRRAFERTFGTLEPGPHHVRLDGATRLPAGMYFLRLTHAGRTVTTRGVLMR